MVRARRPRARLVCVGRLTCSERRRAMAGLPLAALASWAAGEGSDGHMPPETYHTSLEGYAPYRASTPGMSVPPQRMVFQVSPPSDETIGPEHCGEIGVEHEDPLAQLLNSATITKVLLSHSGDCMSWVDVADMEWSFEPTKGASDAPLEWKAVAAP